MAIVISRHTAIKLLELVLVCILIGIYLNEPAGTVSHSFLASGSFLGYLIILVGVFAGGVMGTPVNRRVDLFYCLIGCALFIAVGAIWLDKYSGSGSQKSIGYISIIEGVVFLVDAVLVFRNEP
ncbi:uncharacterized protein LOC131668592 [Phymastichus coffea]|uniref:uncharacterized protein LOC131668592 n=1 Tax=Phymastichus coffea TaxID=108790 RepID=UPI00273C1CFE|nr:uncharacterized protein LOC131668592 [Phymastichus coffea]